MGKYNGNTEFVMKGAAQKLTLRDVFSDMFKKHSLADGERLFMSGTYATTPSPDAMLTGWQKPWLFVWILGACLIILAIGYAMNLMQYDTPTIAFIGTAAVPLAVLTFTWELNIPRNVPAYKLLFMFMAGGLLSILAVALLDDLRTGETGTLTAALTNSIVEETAKLITVVVFIIIGQRGRNGRGGYYYILTGLLIGSAVGNGFSAFESGTYFQRYNGSYELMLVRAVLAPGGHGLWAAMYGAALVMVKGREPLHIKHFMDKRFLIYFAIPIALHTLWNWSDVTMSLPYIGEYSVVHISLIAGGWIILLRLVNSGVVQVVRADSGGAAIKPAGASFTVHCIKGPFTGQSFPLVKGALVLGRDPSRCNLLFPAETPGISRLHCSIKATGGGISVTDSGSTHGTFLENGSRIPSHVPTVLNNGQKFYLASANAMFEVRF